MKADEALILANRLLQIANSGRGFNDVQSLVFLGTWAGQSYAKIARGSGYDCDYVKQVGARLWRMLARAVGEPVSKRNLRSVLHRYQQSYAVERQNSSRPSNLKAGCDGFGSFDSRENFKMLEYLPREESCPCIAIFRLETKEEIALFAKLVQQFSSPLKVFSSVGEVSLGLLSEQLRSRGCLLVFKGKRPSDRSGVDILQPNASR